MINKIENTTNRLAQEYMTFSGRLQQLTPQEYLMFRQQAIQEVSMGIVDIPQEIQKEEILSNAVPVPVPDTALEASQKEIEKEVLNKIETSRETNAEIVQSKHVAKENKPRDTISFGDILESRNKKEEINEPEKNKSNVLARMIQMAD